MHAIFCLLVAATPQAKALNDAGMEAHRAKEFDTAVEKFAAAASADPTWAIPLYNQACALALLRATDPCGRDTEEILELLKKSIALDPKRRERLMKDSDLRSMRNTLAFHNLAGHTNVSEILVDVTWFGPSLGGVFGSSGYIAFKPGTYVATFRSLGKDDVLQTSKKKGAWTLEGRTILLDGKRKGTFGADGKLTIDGWDTYHDVDDDACGA